MEFILLQGEGHQIPPTHTYYNPEQWYEINIEVPMKAHMILGKGPYLGIRDDGVSNHCEN